MRPQTWITIANGLGGWDQPVIETTPKRPTGRRARSTEESLRRMQAAEQKRQRRAQKRLKKK